MAESSIVYGINPVYELIRAGRRRIRGVYLLQHSKGEGIKRILDLLRERDILPVYVSRGVLSSIAKSSEHQGAVALCEHFYISSFKDFLSDIERYRRILIVNNVQNPHNLGAVVRSAYLFGFDGIILSRRHTVSLTPAVVKASAGAIEYVDIAIEENLPQVVMTLKRVFYKIISLDLRGESDIYSVRSIEPVAVIVGGEDSGVSSKLLSLSDLVVKIPVRDENLSLNLSVSAAIMMYQMGKK